MAERVIGLLEAVPWLRAYGGQTFVVKAGGELLEGDALVGLARDVAVLARLGVGVVVVHGGGPQLDRAAAAADVRTERVAGRRITSPALIALAIASWRGTLSAAIVRAVRDHGEDAVGLAGYDGALVSASRRPEAVVTTDAGERQSVDFGLVGDVTGVRADLLRALLAAGTIPVLTPLCAGAGGEILNVNADTVAAEVAVALGAAKLVLATQVPGILRDPEDPRTVIGQASLSELDQLEAAGTLRGGMRPKVAAIRRALTGGVPRVHVVDGRRAGALLEEVFTAEGAGTLIVP
ncbi:MAG: acetylglutamate kinase [Myxococcota bacterium]